MSVRPQPPTVTVTHKDRWRWRGARPAPAPFVILKAGKRAHPAFPWWDVAEVGVGTASVPLTVVTPETMDRMCAGPAADVVGVPAIITRDGLDTVRVFPLPAADYFVRKVNGKGG